MGKKQKFIYWFIGLGCGIMLSGLVITFVGLNIKPYVEKEPALNNTQLAPVFETQEKENSNGNNKENQNENINEEDRLENIHDGKMNTPTEILTGEEETTSKEEYKWVEIPKSSNASQISALLEKEGIIEDAVDFSNYIKEQKMTRNLRAGQQYLPIKGEYDTLLTLLKAEHKN